MSLFSINEDVKEIDYLFEDPTIPNQKFALVSIVGPNFKQKCHVYGMKVRGVCDSLDSAKTMAQKLTRIDPDYDIYTVEVGKFFPLDVDPMQINEIEYQNEQLNKLIKSYLENRENANSEYERRKNEMVKKAISEGKTQKEETEHPVALLNRIEELNNKITNTKSQLEDLMKALDHNKAEYSKLTLNEQEEAETEFNRIKDEITNKNASSSSSKVIN